jgi:hypothetical protein
MGLQRHASTSEDEGGGASPYFLLYTKGRRRGRYVIISSIKNLPVLRIRIRIRRIHMVLGLLDPDPLVRGMDLDPAPDQDLDPSIIKQK